MASSSAIGAKRDREDGQQYIDQKGEGDKAEYIVRNSPYGADRAGLGWGTPFKPAPKCTIEALPNVYIGLSSLNAVPGKKREMSDLLQQYMKKFKCLEHCNPYHRMNDPPAWENWKNMPGKSVMGKNFMYTIKANQYLTHTRMLQLDADTSDHIQNFFVRRCKDIMGDKLGAVLLQLPPQFHNTPEHLDRLKAVGGVIPKEVPIAVEFRHKSWFKDDVYEVLKGLKWALVATHNHDIGHSPVVETGAGFLYFRLHGAVARYKGDYGRPAMDIWATKVAEYALANPNNKVFLFMNNNESHHNQLNSSIVDATYLAQKIKEIAAGGGGSAPAAPPATEEPKAPVPSGPQDKSSSSAAASPSNAKPASQDQKYEVIID